MLHNLENEYFTHFAHPLDVGLVSHIFNVTWAEIRENQKVQEERITRQRALLGMMSFWAVSFLQDVPDFRKISLAEQEKLIHERKEYWRLAREHEGHLRLRQECEEIIRATGLRRSLRILEKKMMRVPPQQTQLYLRQAPQQISQAPQPLHKVPKQKRMTPFPHKILKLRQQQQKKRWKEGLITRLVKKKVTTSNLTAYMSV